jgi:hypothetical protein
MKRKTYEQALRKVQVDAAAAADAHDESSLGEDHAHRSDLGARR